MQVAHRIAVAVEAVFEVFIKFEVVGVVGDGGVAVDVLLRELLPRAGELAQVFGELFLLFLLRREEGVRFLLLRTAEGELFGKLALSRARAFEGGAHLFDAFARRRLLRGKAPRAGTHVRQIFDGGKLAGALFVGDLFVSFEMRFRFPHFKEQFFAAAFELFHARSAFLRLFLPRFEKAGDLLDAPRGRLFVELCLFGAAADGGDALADEPRFAALVFEPHFEGAQLFVEGAQRLVGAGDLFAGKALLFVEGVRLPADGGKAGFRLLDAVAVFARLVSEVIAAEKIGVDLFVFELIGIGAVFFRRLRLFFEGAELLFRLVHALDEDGEVILRALELPLDLPLLRLELHDARRLFEDGAAVFGLGVHDLFDLALPDDGIALLADADAVQQRDDVFQAAGLLVEKVLALARAVQPPRHGDFLVVDIEHPRSVVEDERHFAVRKGAAGFGAVEDDVLHGGAAQRLCRLLAEHPADGVCDVALAAAVRADDAGDAVVEFDGGLVGKRLEPHELYFLKIQCCPSQ